MSDLRRAAQQALEAYDSHEPLAVVMDTLRAALECCNVRTSALCPEQVRTQPEQVDVLAEYTGDGTHRQWVSTGAWLMPGERVLHAGAGHPPRREWRGLTEEEAAACWFVSSVKTWQAIEAALKERNA